MLSAPTSTTVVSDQSTLLTSKTVRLVYVPSLAKYTLLLSK